MTPEELEIQRQIVSRLRDTLAVMRMAVEALTRATEQLDRLTESSQGND